MRKHILGAALTIALAIAALAQPVAAGPRDQPPPQPGWTHSPRYPDDTAAQHGLPRSGAAIDFSSPVIAEVDGNAGNGREVVVGGSDGRLYASKSDGTLIWERTVPVGACSGDTLIYGKPTVGAIYGDGVPYVLVGYGPRGITGCDGGVVVYRGSDGALAWNFSLRAFASQTPEPAETLSSVISAPTVADTDGDGRMEVAFGGLDRNVYLLNSDGSVRWYYHAADTIWGTPLFMNVDGDPQLELVVATDITANPNVIPPTQNGGFLHAFDTQPRTPARITFQTGFIWRTAFDQVLYSSPLAADLLPNNPGLEIAIGSGCYFPGTGAWVKIVNPANGAVLQTLNAPGCVQSSPAAGDIDDDGALELVATTRGGDGRGHIVAWDPTVASPKWDRVSFDANLATNDPNVDLQSPVIADLDGNGSLEVLFANLASVHVVSGRDGAFLTHQGSGPNLPALFAWGLLKGTPAVGDLDGDGDLEVVIGGTNVLPGGPNQNRAHIYAWTNFAGVISSPQGSQQAYSAPWPQLLRSAEARALAIQPGLTASARAISALVEAGGSRTYRLALGSTDGGSISPSIGGESDPDGVLSSDLDGSTLSITLSAAGKGPGTYSAVVTVESPGLPDLPIEVTLRVVADVSGVSLPLIRR